jgi:hypothetical protein
MNSRNEYFENHGIAGRYINKEGRKKTASKYAGVNSWTDEDWKNMKVSAAVNSGSYGYCAGGKEYRVLYSEDKIPLADKKPQQLTITIRYTDGRIQIHEWTVYAKEIPADRTVRVEGDEEALWNIGREYSADIDFTWTRPEPPKSKEGRKYAPEAFAKVCGIANRMPRTVSRKEAFKEAWRIVKNGGFTVPVAGVTFHERQEALKRLAQYDPKDIHAVLVPECDNPHDSNAIAVKVLVNGAKGIYRLGYIPRCETAAVKPFIGRVPELKILAGDIRGARIRIAV